MADRRKDANFSQGWGIAGFITLLVVVAFVVAGTIKQRTYSPPTDPLTPNEVRAESHGPASDAKGAEGGAPAAEGSAKH